MTRTIIDITELVNWEGKLTGVPRVMSELSDRFAQSSHCVFVSWDGARHNYKNVNLVYSKHQENLAHPLIKKHLQPQKISPKLAVITKSLKQRLPLASKVLIGPEKIARKILNRPNQYLELAATVLPRPGDTLFVMADWHGSDQAFVQYLLELKHSGVRLAQICYDLLPIVTPQYSGHATQSLTTYTKQIYPLCDVVFAISQHTKQDVISWLKQNQLPVPKVEVIRLGDNFKLSEPSRPTDQSFAHVKAKAFILCVGTMEARKNHTLLYYTYKLARQQGIELPKLVIVGRRGWKSDDIYEIITSDPELRDKFIVLESVSDEELAWLYSNCLFSIYPSFYEGWGLPIAESIGYGAPCLASNTSSMPEVAGDLIGYFSPFSTDECLQALHTMLKPGAVAKAKRKISAYNPTAWNETFADIQQFLGEIQ